MSRAATAETRHRSLGAAALVLVATLAAPAARAAETVRLAYVGGDGEAWMGFVQAVEEANRQGRFLGFEFVYERVDPDGATAAPAAPDAAGGDETAAMFTAVDAPLFTAIARAHPTLPVLNLSARDDALRELCLANAFYARASDRMLEDALAQWKQAGNDAAGVSAVVWNTRYTRYAASQVTNRFQKTHGTAMTDEAYAGWAGTKLYAQTVMARGTADPAVMLDALHEDVQFDGAKGVPMQFRASGQLNQMILLERDGRVVGEAPVRGVAESHELETLGWNGCKE